MQAARFPTLGTTRTGERSLRATRGLSFSQRDWRKVYCGSHLRCTKGAGHDSESPRGVCRHPHAITPSHVRRSTGSVVRGVGLRWDVPGVHATWWRCRNQPSWRTAGSAAAQYQQTGEPTVEAVVKFLDRWSPENWTPDRFDPADILAYRVGGVIPSDLARVQAFWASECAREHNPVMTCLVTGKAGPVVRRMPINVKGLRAIGGQSTGTSLVSANRRPFTSYGLQESLTSPISMEAGERFGKALNHLLASERSRIYIGPTVYVFWTREESEFDPLSFLSHPDAQSVQRLLDSPRSGLQQHGVRPNDFYVLALSASGGRAVVRDWLETTVPDVQDNLKRWFTAQRIVDARGETSYPMGVYSLAASTYR